MVVFAWVGQILLFFICWKLFHWAFIGVNGRIGATGIVAQLVVNVILSIILLIILTNVTSVWWLMAIVGAAIGVLTGQISSRGSSVE